MNNFIKIILFEGKIIFLLVAGSTQKPFNIIIRKKKHSDLFLARLDEVQEELLYYPRRRCWRWRWRGGGVGVSKMLKFYVKVFYVMGKALSGELSCPFNRSGYH